jgi:hypothetical protein
LVCQSWSPQDFKDCCDFAKPPPAIFFFLLAQWAFSENPFGLSQLIDFLRLSDHFIFLA